jgi:diguanylate cyclase (GGDEF)-like protein
VWSDTQALPPDLRVTVSAGVATCVPGEAVEALVARADAALYQAKKAGRNCFVMAP